MSIFSKTGHALCHGLAKTLQVPLRTAQQNPQPGDAIVVLGAPVRRNGQLTGLVKERVEAGVSLWQQGLGKVVCFTGHRGEAEAMAEYARSVGLPEDAILVEPAARNTRENALFSAKLLSSAGCRSVYVVSQPFHLRRAAFLFKQAGLEPLPWYEPDTLQFRKPEKAVTWLVREYVAWCALAVREATTRPRT